MVVIPVLTNLTNHVIANFTFTVSMEAWQSQQRAQKQKDLQNKNQSAQILQNYRGGIKEEDELLKKIRLADQQKKKEAQDNLQNFRANADGIKTKSPTKSAAKYDGPLSEMVAPPMKDDPANTIAAGAVSSIAANFTAVNKPTEAGGAEGTAKSTNAVVETPDATAESYDGAAVSQSPELVDLAASSGSHSTNGSWVQVTSEETPPEPTVIATNGTAATGEAITDDKPSRVEDEQPAFARLDVDFSFGLISTRISPSFDEYMKGVADVVTSALEDGEMKQHISYDPQNIPFVEKISKDGTSFCAQCLLCLVMFQATLFVDGSNQHK